MKNGVFRSVCSKSFLQIKRKLLSDEAAKLCLSFISIFFFMCLFFSLFNLSWLFHVPFHFFVVSCIFSVLYSLAFLHLVFCSSFFPFVLFFFQNILYFTSFFYFSKTFSKNLTHNSLPMSFDSSFLGQS